MEERLDIRLIREGLAGSREKAKELIETGCITVNGKTAGKAGQRVAETDEILLSQTAGFLGGYHSDEVFVSRGGHKLARALDVFGFSPEGLICLDAGASTGGFTDCLLQRGAAHVYAVDVGHGQFSDRLRPNEKITVQEGKNVRYLSPEDYPCPMDLVVADLSYISLSKVFGALSSLLRENGTLICLVKPQFEAGPGAVDKRGVIRDASVQEKVLRLVAQSALSFGLMPEAFTYSPIRGPEGNIEFLMKAVKRPPSADTVLPDARKTVQDAVRNLNS